MNDFKLKKWMDKGVRQNDPVEGNRTGDGCSGIIGPEGRFGS